MFKKIIGSICLVVLIVVFSGSTVSARSKRRYKYWRVNVHFIIGSKDCFGSNANVTRKKIIRWLRNEISNTEYLYKTKPGVKISPKFYFKKSKGGKTLAELKFKNNRRFHRYMDRHFDHVVRRKRTRGYMRVLVVDALKVGKRTLGGMAHFPYFSRRHAAVIVNNSWVLGKSRKTSNVLAHELGHVFNLRHTWDIALCNRKYKKGKKHQGKTVRSDGSINLMDYKQFDSSRDIIRPAYLNKCQRKRAARIRRRWMTRRGRVNYRRLKGLR